MSWFLAQPLTWLVATLLVYRGGCAVRDRTGHPAAQPVLVAVVVLGAVLVLLPGDVASRLAPFVEGTQGLVFLLGPATVALAVPLHRQLHRLRGYLLGLVVSLVVGVLVSVGSSVALVRLLGGDETLMRTVAPKATTAPVAIALSGTIQGIPALTAAIGISAGILGAVAAPTVLTWLRVRDHRARGLATGAVSHGIGTSRMLLEHPTEGAFSGLSMGLTALATSALLPVLVPLLVRLLV
ncbi:LrgB family protein [Nocardioides acrostichi]|uniref:LrgB family protein n=1 Tax=Nocardioides acrostichi TaxID=2784339 RepID=A0A930V3E3_9ACTN|nr:LrgB family protein [Nocardioides acrostichi]MBF4162484.1 LrgB family protein [Nocardioides acrostichi]